MDQIGNMMLVEVKMASRVEMALKASSVYERRAYETLMDQLARYLLFKERLGTGGVRYVVTETATAAGRAPISSARATDAVKPF